jgi:hypothetical protein
MWEEKVVQATTMAAMSKWSRLETISSTQSELNCEVGPPKVEMLDFFKDPFGEESICDVHLFARV